MEDAEVHLHIVGKVVGKGRPRVTKHGTYTPKSTREYQQRIADAWPMDITLHGPVSVEIDVYREIPKSRPKKVQSEHDTYKPDIDNIAKIVLDALNDADAWGDDCYVTDLRVVKHDRKRDATEHMNVTVRGKHER